LAKDGRTLQGSEHSIPTTTNQGIKMNVYQKLNMARSEFHKVELKKSGHNKFAGYKYFELADFVVPAIEVFSRVRLVSVISFSPETATMTIINIDEPSETITITSPMSEANLKGCHPVQNLGAVQTYLRRYLWVAALEIIEHDAIDSSKPVEEKNKVVITPAQGIADSLPPEEQKYLQELAHEIMTLDGKQGLERMEAENLEAEQKVALWSMLPSKVRSEIKKAKE
jgi:hypothetical protein